MYEYVSIQVYFQGVHVLCKCLSANAGVQWKFCSLSTQEICAIQKLRPVNLVQ